MGGAVTIMAAMQLPLDGAVPFYGIPPPTAGDPGSIKCPVQAHFANIDDWCSPEKVDELELAFKRGNVNYELFRYDAHHAFMNETRPEVYDAAVAEQAFGRTLAFLEKVLG
jgi:carboxymethylenebutenolidase